MKVKTLMERLEKMNPEAEVLMHGICGKPLLFVVVRQDDTNHVVLEDAGDANLKVELSARFETAAEKQLDELDFFMDLLDTGFRIEDIEKYLPDRYEYSKQFLEEHGLI